MLRWFIFGVASLLFSLFASVAGLLLVSPLHADETSPTWNAHFNLAYAGTANPRQTLDLFTPRGIADTSPLPVVVYIHGGGWRNGIKNQGYGFLKPLVLSGKCAGVTINYRLSQEATWPAQGHDVKAAIRWIKANASVYGLDPDRIAMCGFSAGGHLAAFLGTTADQPECDGSIGPHAQLSSRVTCVVDFFGPSDLTLTSPGFGEARARNPRTPESLLLGGPLADKQPLAMQASPALYVSSDDPPFLIIHGTADPIVPFAQSQHLHDRLLKTGISSTLIPVSGGGHDGFKDPRITQQMGAFLLKNLQY